MAFCFEIGPGTSGWFTTNAGNPPAGAFFGVKAHNDGTATWKYKTAGATDWPSSFTLTWGDVQWSSWTGSPFNTSNQPFSSDTVPITLDTGDQLFSATVIGGGLVYLKRINPVHFVFYTNISADYLPAQAYSFSTAQVPGGTWRHAEDQESVAQTLKNRKKH